MGRTTLSGWRGPMAGIRMFSLSRSSVISAVLALLVVGTPQARACDWWWACGERSHANRQAPPAYGYRRLPRPYRGGAWAYGYSSPARAYDPYAAWPSTSIPESRWYTGTALQVPNAAGVGLTAPTASAEGLLEGGLPPRGPSLFGPPAPPPGWAYAYGVPSYGYAPARAYGPPSDTPSWWVEPRRRR
jgi:hypothetical protein